MSVSNERAATVGPERVQVVGVGEHQVRVEIRGPALGKPELEGSRTGNLADLIVVDGNPLDNFKVLYGTGLETFDTACKPTRRGGVRWTIKNGVVFDAPALLRDVEARTATPSQAEEVHAHIRGRLEEHYGKKLASCAIILYGGSVKPANAYSLFKEKNIDGFLVGGASLDAGDFAGIAGEALRAYREEK